MNEERDLEQLDRFREYVKNGKRVTSKNYQGWYSDDNQTQVGLEKLERLENIEEELGFPLEEAIDILFDFIKNTDEFRCVTCTNMMANELGCDGNCQHNYTFTKKQLLEKFKIRISHCSLSKGE